jgi:hypothetical protein
MQKRTSKLLEIRHESTFLLYQSIIAIRYIEVALFNWTGCAAFQGLKRVGLSC